MDPYEVLGVSRSATSDEVRAAFRAKAREHHPDRNPDDSGAQQRFQKINAAFQLLSDPRKRETFDRYGTESPRSAGSGSPFDFEDLVADLFGVRGRRRAQRVPVDVQRTVELTFEEAALGCTKSVSYERLDRCSRCEGSGASAGSQLSVCRTCRGAGRVAVAVGFFGAATAQPCPDCAGRGRVPMSPCAGCGGKGLESKRRTLEVTVPPGIESEARQSVSGAGHRAAPTEPAGDLILLIKIKPHSVFRREGDDVISELSVPFTMAALGGQISVQTVHGKADLAVPAGTQAGATIRLKDQGMPHRFRRGRGEHLFLVKVVVPIAPSPRARQLISELDAVLEAPKEGSLFSALKSWFG